MRLERARRHEPRSSSLSAVLVVGATAVSTVVSIVSGNPIVGPALVGGTIIVLAVVLWLWENPVRGAYVLFGATVLLAAYDQSGLTDYIGAYLPFFRDIKSWSHVGIVFSIAELFMVLVFLVWLLKGIAERRLHFDRGSLMLPLGLYMVMVLFAEIHGLSSGGSFRDSLWEVRSQAYMLVAYVLICNLVNTRSQVVKLLWILLICAGLRGLEATYTYVVVLRAHGFSNHELYPHEQSYFFGAFLTLTVILFLYGGSQRMKRVALGLLPFEIMGELANNRRASMAALCISLLVLFLITWILRPQFRRRIAWSLVFMALIYPPYYAHYQNRTGLLALPARAISSNFHPTANDASSNQYRVFEDGDIMATVKTSPLTGYGFGKPMLTPHTLPNIGYVFQYLMPHNSILWVWMRLGTIGYLLLWFLIGGAILQLTRVLMRVRDPFLQGLTIFVLVMLLQQIITAYVDLQWSNYRTMIFTGALFALISRLGMFAKAEDRSRSNEDRRTKARASSMVSPIHHPLALSER